MHAGACWKRWPERSEADENETERHEGIGHMKNKDETVAPGPVSRPAGEAPCLEQTCRDQRDACRCKVRGDHPRRERHPSERNRDNVETSERDRRAHERRSRAFSARWFTWLACCSGVIVSSVPGPVAHG